jgi:uncharacterized protein YbaR (Trm112 family)
MLDPEILKLMRCPETHQELRAADATLLEQLNGKIQAGALKTRSGQVVKEKIDGGFVRADGKWLYVIRGGLPVMLVDEAIPLNS